MDLQVSRQGAETKSTIMATTIRFGGYQGDKSVHTRAAQVFCSALRRQLGDSVDITFEQNIVDKGQAGRGFAHANGNR